MSVPEAPVPLDRAQADWRVFAGTVRTYLLRLAANPIMLMRAPVQPALMLVAFTITYHASGQTMVASGRVAGFLVIGILATEAWSATVWGSGNALQSEMYAGTVGAVLAAPTRTVPVILGYGVGATVWGLPGLASALAVGAVLGARFDLADPAAAAVSLVAVYASTLCIGLGFAGLFILSRQSNALSNFLQTPIYLLAGFFVPRTVLPGWLQPVSDAIPLSHALDALRGTALAGRSLADVGGQLLVTAVTSVMFLLVGAWALRRMDDAVRRRGTLDLL